MPEGHTVHRLAAAIRTGFGGERVVTSSPQGRFPEADALAGWTLADAEAAGKHLLLAFTPGPDVEAGAPVTRYVHVHLGLYGSWTFAGEEGFASAPAIGAPRLRIGEREDALGGGEPWREIVPRETVRLRIVGPRGLADLTGPTACEELDAAGRQAVLDRLGPDPLREDAEPERFVQRVLRSRTAIGTLLMDQSVVAGIGNIYRAEILYRARLNPYTPGNEVPEGVLRGIWRDWVGLLQIGVDVGRMMTIDGLTGDDYELALRDVRHRHWVYGRAGEPCRRCGTPIALAEMQNRKLYWCPSCQA